MREWAPKWLHWVPQRKLGKRSLASTLEINYSCITLMDKVFSLNWSVCDLLVDTQIFLQMMSRELSSCAAFPCQCCFLLVWSCLQSYIFINKSWSKRKGALCPLSKVLGQILVYGESVRNSPILRCLTIEWPDTSCIRLLNKVLYFQSCRVIYW